VGGGRQERRGDQRDQASWHEASRICRPAQTGYQLSFPDVNLLACVQGSYRRQKVDVTGVMIRGSQSAEREPNRAGGNPWITFTWIAAA